MLSMDQLYNFLGWEELPGTRDELEVLRIWIDEWAQKKYQISSSKSKDFRCPAYALLSYGVASRCQVSRLRSVELRRGKQVSGVREENKKTETLVIEI